ncbi:hypothetical protein PR048_025824 [Dryococelus australis]|uniref:Uncharacterized protein n=1 Tax=Dryococelus australis TaxID=614101 RepID=A0ABQ9GJM3_9NEOP|nr:hypothetical protein PR048_025824 [Dryococelus australis]
MTVWTAQAVDNSAPASQSLRRRLSTAVCSCACTSACTCGHHVVRNLTFHCGDVCVWHSGNTSDRQAAQSAADQFALVSYNLSCTQKLCWRNLLQLLRRERLESKRAGRRVADNFATTKFSDTKFAHTPKKKEKRKLPKTANDVPAIVEWRRSEISAHVIVAKWSGRDVQYVGLHLQGSAGTGISTGMVYSSQASEMTGRMSVLASTPTREDVPESQEDDDMPTAVVRHHARREGSGLKKCSLYREQPVDVKKLVLCGPEPLEWTLNRNSPGTAAGTVSWDRDFQSEPRSLATRWKHTRKSVHATSPAKKGRHAQWHNIIQNKPRPTRRHCACLPFFAGDVACTDSLVCFHLVASERGSLWKSRSHEKSCELQKFVVASNHLWIDIDPYSLDSYRLFTVNPFPSDIVSWQGHQMSPCTQDYMRRPSEQHQKRRRAAVAERLLRSPPSKANRVQSPAGSPDFRKWESYRTIPLVGGFSRGSPDSPPLHSDAAPYSLQSPSSALKTSLFRVAQISSLTHFYSRDLQWQSQVVVAGRRGVAESLVSSTTWIKSVLRLRLPRLTNQHRRDRIKETTIAKHA